MTEFHFRCSRSQKKEVPPCRQPVSSGERRVVDADDSSKQTMAIRSVQKNAFAYCAAGAIVLLLVVFVTVLPAFANPTPNTDFNETNSLVATGEDIVVADDEDSAQPVYTANQLLNALRNGGNYYLAQSITLNNTSEYGYLLTVNKDVQLDLNEREVIFDTVNPTIHVTGATLTVKDALGRPRDGGFRLTQSIVNPLFEVTDGGNLVFAHNVSATVPLKSNIVNIAFGGQATLTGDGSMSGITSSKPLLNSGALGIKLTIDQYTISKCSNTDGPVVHIYSGGGNITMTDKSVIRSCDYWREGLIFIANNATLLFQGTIQYCGDASDSMSRNSGPVIFVNGATVTMDCLDDEAHGIHQNNCNGYAGAVLVDGLFTLRHGAIENNRSAETLGQIYVKKGGRARLEGGTVIGYEASTQGSCVNVESGGGLVVDGATLAAPKKTSVNQGGLIYSEGEVYLNNGVLDGTNVRATRGGLICMKTGTGWYNAKLEVNGGVLKNGMAVGNQLGEKGFGGAIAILGKDTQVTIERSRNAKNGPLIENCKASDAGGAIWSEGNSGLYLRSGSIQNCQAGPIGFTEKSDLNTFEDDPDDGSMCYGGGIYVGPGTDFSMEEAFAIRECKAEGADVEESDRGFGGAIYANGAKVNLNDGATIEECNALTDGGACYVTGGSFTCNAKIRSNRAGNNGGGIYCDNAALQLSATIQGNSANEFGGGVFVANGDQASVTFSSPASFPLVIGGNSCENNPRAVDLYLDYLGEAQKSPSAVKNITINVNGNLKQGDSISFGLSKEAVLATGNVWREILSANSSAMAYFELAEGNEELVLLPDRVADKLYTAVQANVVHDRETLERAVENGGMYVASSDIDLSGETGLTGFQVKKNLQLTMFHHWITANTRSMGAPLFTVEPGAVFTLGMLASTGEEGGLRGTAKADNLEGHHTAVLVNADGEFRLHCTIEGFACAQNDEGAAVTLAGKTDPFASAARFASQGGIIRNCLSSGSNGSVFATGNTVMGLKGGTISAARGAENGGCITQSSGKLTAENVTFNGETTRNGGCIYLSNSAKATLTHCTLKDGIARYGGGIYEQDSELNLFNSKVTNCKAITFNVGVSTLGGCGGGIYERKSALYIDKDSEVKNNIAQKDGGGLYCTGYRNGDYMRWPRIDGTISDNAAFRDGGGMYVRDIKGCEMTIAGVIRANTAEYYGGGLFVDEECPVNLVDNVAITGNFAKEAGGGLCVAAEEHNNPVKGYLPAIVTGNYGNDGSYQRRIESNVAFVPSAHEAGGEGGGEGTGGDQEKGDSGASEKLSCTGDVVDLMPFAATAVVAAVIAAFAFRRLRTENTDLQ